MHAYLPLELYNYGSANQQQSILVDDVKLFIVLFWRDPCPLSADLSTRLHYLCMFDVCCVLFLRINHTYYWKLR